MTSAEVKRRLERNPELRRVRRALELSGRFHLYIVVLHRPADSGAVEELLGTAPGATLLGALPDLHDVVETLKTQPGILNLSRLSDSEPTHYFQRLNERRNHLVSDAHHALVIVTSAEQEVELARTAPDLWSVRSDIARVVAPVRTDYILSPYVWQQGPFEGNIMQEDIERLKRSGRLDKYVQHATTEATETMLDRLDPRAFEAGRDIRTWVERRLSQPLTEDDDDAIVVAGALRAAARVGAVFGFGGRGDEVELARRSVHHFSRLAEKDPRRFLPELARSWRVQSAVCEEHALLKHAKAAAEEAAHLFDEIRRGGAIGHEDERAVVLTDISRLSLRVRDFGHARAIAKEAVAVARASTERERKRCVHLTRALDQLGVAEAMNGALEASWRALQEAVNLSPGPGASHLENLYGWLRAGTNHWIVASELDRLADVEEQQEEVEAIFDILSLGVPEVVLPLFVQRQLAIAEARRLRGDDVGAASMSKQALRAVVDTDRIPTPTRRRLLERALADVESHLVTMGSDPSKDPDLRRGQAIANELQTKTATEQSSLAS